MHLSNGVHVAAAVQSFRTLQLESTRRSAKRLVAVCMCDYLYLCGWSQQLSYSQEEKRSVQTSSVAFSLHDESTCAHGSLFGDYLAAVLTVVELHTLHRRNYGRSCKRRNAMSEYMFYEWVDRCVKLLDEMISLQCGL